MTTAFFNALSVTASAGPPLTVAGAGADEAGASLVVAADGSFTFGNAAQASALVVSAAGAVTAASAGGASVAVSDGGAVTITAASGHNLNLVVSGGGSITGLPAPPTPVVPGVTTHSVIIPSDGSAVPIPYGDHGAVFVTANSTGNNTTCSTAAACFAISRAYPRNLPPERPMVEAARLHSTPGAQGEELVLYWPAYTYPDPTNTLAIKFSSSTSYSEISRCVVTLLYS